MALQDNNGDRVDDRLYAWYNEIARMIGRKPHITDTLRSYGRQRQYFLAGYGANPDKPEGAPHVEGRALDIRTKDSNMSAGDWKAIADAAAKNIGLKDFRAIVHTGTAPHLHLEIGGNNPHLPDNCTTCTQGKDLFAGNTTDITNKVPLAKPVVHVSTKGQPDAIATDDPAAAPRGRTMRIASADPTFGAATLGYAPVSYRNDPFASLLGERRPATDPATEGRLKPGRRAFSENLPSQVDDEVNGLINPSNKAAARYAALTGRDGQMIGLGENRLATHGETRAAIFRRLVDAGGQDIKLDDLKSVHQWGPEGAPYKKVIDGFIKEKGLDSTMVYKMLAQSERQLRRKDAPLIGTGSNPTTIMDVFMRAQNIEEKRMGVDDPANAPVLTAGLTVNNTRTRTRKNGVEIPPIDMPSA